MEEVDRSDKKKYSTKVMEKNGIKKPNDQFINAISGLYLSMHFLGIWPRLRSQNLYSLIWYIHTIGFAFYTFGPVGGLIMQKHEGKKLINSIGFVIPIALVFVKLLTFTTRRKRIGTMLCSLEEDWINLDRNTSIIWGVPDSKKIMVIYSKWAKFSFYTYMAMITFIVGNYVRDWLVTRVSRSDDTDLDYFLPVPNCWYPLDYNRSFNIQFLTVTQPITAMTFILASASMDCIFFTVALHLCGQFKILGHFIESITYDSSRPEYSTVKIRLIVQRHQILLELAESLQESYSFIILEQLLTCTLSICFLGYMIILEMESESMNSTDLLQAGFLCLTRLETIFVYCLVGDHLTNESIAVAMAVYNTEWYICPRSINLSLLILMIRARKPVAITGAKLLPISLESFAALMKTTLSYLSVLRAMGIGAGVIEEQSKLTQGNSTWMGEEN